MLNIDKSMFKVKNTKVNNDYSLMLGTYVQHLISVKSKERIIAGEKEITDGDYHVVLVEEVEKDMPLTKKEEPKTDIMRKNKKVID